MEYAKLKDGSESTSLLLETKEHALEAAKSACSPVRELLEALIAKVNWPAAKKSKK